MNNEILKNEQKKLNDVQHVVDLNISDLSSRISKTNDSIDEMLKYVNSNKLDSVERRNMYSFINDSDESVSRLAKNRDFLNKIRPKPFFAKIAFKQQDSLPESYYVGLKNIEAENKQIVIDWRTPVASLLYFSSLGKASYDSPTGKIDVDLQLKRQFRLEPDKIVSYIDTDTKIDDGFLQAVLSQNTTSYMHNIVQTIQEEQNKIIRRPPHQSIIIDGVAGSGKTSIALHRISYILYCNRGSLSSENILIVSPNKLFSSYIGELLPELGEENVYSCPITQVLNEAKLMPKKYGDKMAMVEKGFASQQYQNQVNLKRSVAFFDEVEQFLIGFDIRPFVIDAFKSNEYMIPQKIYEKIPLQKTSDLKTKTQNYVHMVLVSSYPILAYRQIEKIENQILKHLKNTLTTKAVFAKLYLEKSLKGLDKIGYEDAPVYAYINFKLNGAQTNKAIKHIFVDEMQDYDPFSIYLLKNLFPDAVMTFAGDYNQNILSSSSNIQMLKRLFPNIPIDKLDVSYRSTFEITAFAQNLINKNFCYNFIRHGEKPTATKVKDMRSLDVEINDICTKFPNDKVAIITKTLTEARDIAAHLPEFDLVANDDDPSILSSNRIITTTFLSKGLEYDRVIIPFVNQNNYAADLERQNLYVACTRALHGVYIFYNETLPDFVQAALLEDFSKKNAN